VNTGAGISDTVSFELSREITTALRQSIQSGLSSAFLGAFALTLRKLESENNIRIVIEYSGRDSEENARAVSMLVKTLPFGVSISGDDSLTQIAEKCADAMYETIDNSSFPLVSVSSEFGFSPKVAFNYIGEMLGGMKLGDACGTEALIGVKPEPKMPVTVTVSHDESGSSKVTIEYDTGKYSESAANRFAQSYEALLRSFANTPDALCSDTSALSDAQLEEVRSFIRADEHVDETLSIPDVFAQHALKDPGKAAVIGTDRSYTYAELADVTDRIANALIANGVRPGSPVAFILRRTSRIPAAQLGIIKSGGCFIPIDPDYPPDRVLHVLSDSAAPVVIIDKADTKTSELIEKAGSNALVLDFDSVAKEGTPGTPDIGLSGESPAYIIYTSGTTGLPKGVQLRHKGLISYVSPVEANKQFMDFVSVEAVYPAIFTVAFDGSIKEIFGCLLNGLTVVIASESECRNPGEFAALVEKNACTNIGGTPSVIEALIASPKVQAAISDIKAVWAGGEKFPRSLYEVLRKAAPNASIINSYGPTECTVETNTKYLTDEDGEITIGPSVRCTPEFVMDIDGQPLPAGCTGELWIGGDQVAIGYLNRPELNAEKFVTLPPGLADRLGLAQDMRRFYRSGDLARMNQKGEPVILGRNDSQVKFHGLRIELGEIEKAIESYPGIVRVYVQIREIGGIEQLCAYFTADCDVDITDLTSHISKSLTAYMVPAAYKQMDGMPLTPNGKVDTKALPEPELLTQSEYAPPRTPAEKRFCEIYKSVLGLPRDVGIDDDFFRIGGTSLLATQVTIDAGDSGYDVTYADVFANPTPRALALCVEDAPEATSAAETEDYDYTKIDAFLAANEEAALLSHSRRPLGNICLTGATGYLGAHILYAFIKDFYGVVFVPVRAETAERAERRLKTVLMYYFEDDFAGLFGSRIVVVPGDITEDALYTAMEHLPIDTYINAAANVKHFSAGTDIEDINVGGTEMGLGFAKKIGSAFVQISTTSTSGLSVGGTPDPRTEFTEKMLYFGQDLSNKYIRSKFIAERSVLEAAADGMSAKVIRVGNLMARDNDGIFQANFNTNSFLKSFKAYRYIGKIPYEVMNDPVEFAPIGEVARGVLLLAGTPRENAVFHLFNNHNVTMGDFVMAMNEAGYTVKPCEREEFDAAFAQALHDREKSEVVAGLMAYANGEADAQIAGFATSCTLTLSALARKDFYWPITDRRYFARLIDHLGSLGFFDLPGEV
jgi:amino acid adenylation domain-containing protein